MRYSHRLRERAAKSTQGAAHWVRRQYCFHLLFLQMIIKKTNLKNDRLYASQKHPLKQPPHWPVNYSLTCLINPQIYRHVRPGQRDYIKSDCRKLIIKKFHLLNSILTGNVCHKPTIPESRLDLLVLTTGLSNSPCTNT